MKIIKQRRKPESIGTSFISNLFRFKSSLSIRYLYATGRKPPLHLVFYFRPRVEVMAYNATDSVRNRELFPISTNYIVHGLPDISETNILVKLS